MINSNPLPAETYATADELIRLGRIAVNDAQAESRRLGVPNVYSINGHIYYETRSGELSKADPGSGGNEAPEPCDAVERQNWPNPDASPTPAAN